MRRCVLGCPKGNVLHKFPDAEDKRNEWLKIINMEDCPLNNLYLCTRHFSRRMKGKTRLVWNSVPTLNLRGVDENDVECEVVERDLLDNPKTSPSPIRKTSEISVLPSKSKVVGSKGRLQSDPLYEPSKTLTDEQLVKYQVKFVNGKAVRIAPKTTQTTMKKESTKTDESHILPQIQKRTKNLLVQANVIKHQLKIVNGKAYKINAPEETKSSKAYEQDGNDEHTGRRSSSKRKTITKSKEKPIFSVKRTTEKPTLVKSANVRSVFTNSENNSSPISLEFEVLDNIEALKNKENDTFIEECDEDDEDVYTDSLNKISQDEQMFAEFKDGDDSNELLDSYNEDQQTQMPICIDKDQAVEFGNRIRSRPRQKCGYVECFTTNNTFCLTCFYCGVEFELWDWQQFIEHINNEHIPKRRPYVKNRIKSVDSAQEEEELILNNTIEITPKVRVQKAASLTPIAEVNIEKEDVEVASEKIFEDVMKENIENYVKEEEFLIESYDHVVEDDIEMCDEEDWQVDKLDEYKDIEIYEDRGSMIGDDINVPTIDYEKEEDDDEEVEDEYNDNEDIISQACINLKTSEQTRVLEFLNLLRLQPVLWHPRRYGPPIYDEEMKNFLMKFDKSMSSIDFRRSVEHLRNQYKRFTPLTPRGRSKLQQDAYLRECIQIIKEVADKLSKPYAFHCDVCSFCFLDENRMLTHKYLKHKIGDLKYICSCGVRFAYESQKDDHEHLHKLKPRFTCTLCGSNFIFNRLLRDHMNEFHPETQENPLPYECSKCDAKFPSINKRAHHMERHRTPKYHCELCNQSYRTSFRFKHHLKRHQDQRDWVCEHCGKAFVEKRSLNAHLFRVHRDGGIKCIYCRTYFAGQESLDAHNKKFHPDGTNLDRMKNIRKYFNTKYKCKNGEPQYKRVFRCKECGEYFKNMWTLVGHKRQTGHDLKVFNCPHCDSVLSSPKTLMGHMRRIHKLPITTMADLRNELLQPVEGEEDGELLTACEEEVEVDTDEGLKLEEIEIFEAYEIE